MKRETTEPNDRLSSVIRLACTFAFSLYVFSAGMASVCSAQPPEKAACNQTDPYEKLKCKHDGVATQIEFMTSMYDEGSLLGNQLTEGQRGQMMGVKMKSARAKIKSAATDFKKLAKSDARSNKKACYFLPLTPQDDSNGDGVCDYDPINHPNAKCAAIELDAAGNLQACNPNKKNKGKGQGGLDLECDQKCDPDDGVTQEEKDEMLLEAGPMDKAYDSLETDLHKLNGDLESLNNNSSTSLLSRSVSVSQNSCESPVVTPGLALADGILRQVSVTARGVAGMAAPACKQTVVAAGFGGNGAVACLIFNTAASVLEVSYVTVDEILKAERSAIQDSTLSCLQKTAGDINAGFTELRNDHTTIMNNDNANKDKIMEKIQQVRDELVRLLNTPLGLREQFPVK